MGQLHKGMVFVTDDEDALRDSIQEALEDAGYLVLSAREGREALARMRGYSGRSVAVLDLGMPGMSGWELMDKMSGDPGLKHIPIIVITGQADVEPKGAWRILRKPLRIDELLEAVATRCS
jgi:CheY-like chemotaxis protein